MRKFLQNIRFEISKVDHSLYVKKIGCGLIVIFIYVDDLIVTRSDKDEIEHVKKVLQVEFDMKDLRELSISWALRWREHLKAYGCCRGNMC